MKINLAEYQKKAVSEMKTGSILRGGVGSGKSRTAIAYYYKEEYPKQLYIITVAKKRDSLDWEEEAKLFRIKPIVDSWNNISKYKDVKNAFFIFDEQKVVGYGAWVKAFIKISRTNNWIILSATPGDTWMDYLPVFIANGFFKNKSDFVNKHVVYSNFTSFPKIDRYVGVDSLQKLKTKILVEMDYKKKTIDHISKIILPYDKTKFEQIYKDRWNPFTNLPIKGASEACYSMRKVVNSDSSRLSAVLELQKKHQKIIVFYNFDYELESLRKLNELANCPVSEYNGHLHEPIPQGDRWIYLAQYISAGEAWNCIETNAIVLYSRNYSYKQTIQAMGRIDRQNTPFLNLYYYFLTSNSVIDLAIEKAYIKKKNFNDRSFVEY